MQGALKVECWVKNVPNVKFSGTKTSSDVIILLPMYFDIIQCNLEEFYKTKKLKQITEEIVILIIYQI